MSTMNHLSFESRLRELFHIPRFYQIQCYDRFQQWCCWSHTILGNRDEISHFYYTFIISFSFLKRIFDEVIYQWIWSSGGLIHIFRWSRRIEKFIAPFFLSEKNFGPFFLQKKFQPPIKDVIIWDQAIRMKMLTGLGGRMCTHYKVPPSPEKITMNPPV